MQNMPLTQQKLLLECSLNNGNNDNSDIIRGGVILTGEVEMKQASN